MYKQFLKVLNLLSDRGVHLTTELHLKGNRWNLFHSLVLDGLVERVEGYGGMLSGQRIALWRITESGMQYLRKGSNSQLLV